MTHAAAIKSFVIETLGCRCPESVFEQIDYHDTSTIPGLETPFKRLLIGHRLLIYLLECDDATALQSALPLLVEKGKAERDDQGYHRLRVVIATDQPQSIQHEADRLFSSLGDVDEKVHLHVLARGRSLDRIGQTVLARPSP
jgi:hypothetical protein